MRLWVAVAHEGSAEWSARLLHLVARQLRAAIVGVALRSPLTDSGLALADAETARIVGDLAAEVLAADRPVMIHDGLGVPLRGMDESSVGVLCAFDEGPRRWTDVEVGMASGLAAALAPALAAAPAAELARAEADLVRQRLEFLAAASAALAGSLDLATTVQTVVQLTVPVLGDWCAVHVTEDDVVRRLVLHAQTADGTTTTQGLERYDAYPRSHPVGPAKVVETGRVELIPEVTDGWLQALAIDDAHLKLLRTARWRSVCMAPLSLRGRTFGSLACVTTQSQRRYGDEDVRVIQQLADRVAVALDNARLYRELDDVAQTLQRSLLPPQLPLIPGLEHGVHYRPAQSGGLVCGDFYDVFRIEGNDWMAAIGDVCGKGIQAAALTGLARHVIRTAAMGDGRPAAVLGQLNQALLREETVPPDARSATAVCLRVRPRGNAPAAIRLSSAGHPKPLILQRDGTVRKVLCPGLLLGILPDHALGEVRFELRRGDALVLYTDGVPEARRDREQFTSRRLRSVLSECRGRHAQAIADEIARQVTEWEDQDVRDDLAILVLRNPPP